MAPITFLRNFPLRSGVAFCTSLIRRRAQNRQVLLPVALGYVSCDQDPIGATDPMRTVYMLTSLAVTQRGTRRMAQAEVALDPPIAMNAAVMSDDNVTLNGSLTVSGF